MGETVTAVLHSAGTFTLYAIAAVFTQNAVFARALGVSRLVKLVDDENVDSLTFCVLLCFVQLLSAGLAFVVNRLWLGQFYLRTYVRALVLVGCTAVGFAVVLLVVVTWFSAARAKRIAAVLPMASFNCCVLGTLLISTTQSYTLLQTLGFALGSGIGYAGAVYLVTEGKRRLENADVPATFRGLPVTLLYVSILALAIYGFTGHTLSY